MIRGIEWNPDDDVKETPAQRRHTLRNNEITALLTRRLPERVRNDLQEEYRRNTHNHTLIRNQQLRRTRERRQDLMNISSINQNGRGVAIGDSYSRLSSFFRELNGRSFTISFSNLSYGAFRVSNYNHRLFRGSLWWEFMEDTNTYKQGRFTIVFDNDLPRNKTYEQVFREDPNQVCVLNSLIHQLNDSKKPDSKMNNALRNKIEKQKKKYPNGMTSSQIQELCDDLSTYIKVFLLLPLSQFITEFVPKTDKKNTRFRLLNSRENHVDTYHHYPKEVMRLQEDDFIQAMRDYSDNLCYVTLSSHQGPYQLITKDGIYVKDSATFDKSCFFNQIYNHSFTSELFTQSLTWTSGNRNVSSSNEYFEYDLKQAYLKYPHHYAGYLLYSETGIFSPMMIPLLSNLYENDFSTLVLEVKIIQMTELQHAFRMPELIKLPLWALTLLSGSVYVITQIEVRKKFKINMDLVESSFKKFYKGDNYRRDWKRTYTRLFGITGKKENEIIYDIAGKHSPEFIDYLSTKSDLKFRQRDDSSFFCMETRKNTNYSPYILHFVSLYCQVELMKIAQSVPFSTIMNFTLDSIVLSESLDKIPPNFSIKECNYKQEYSFCYLYFEEDLPQQFTFPSLFPVNRINWELGAGGSGKTFTNKKEHPESILVVPTRALLKDKKKEFDKHFPNQFNRVITYHNFMGWNHTNLPYHSKSGIQIEGKFHIDETTMLDSTTIDEMIKKHPNSQLRFMGDIHKSGIPYQCYMKTESRYSPINITYHSEDYRSKDSQTKLFKAGLRRKMDLIFESPDYHEYNVESLLPSKFGSLDPTKLILTGARWVADYYTSIGLNAMNSHRVQGSTLTEDYQIDLTTISIQKFYTLISRCESVSQITFIEPSNKRDARWAFRQTYFAKKGDQEEYMELEEEDQHSFFE
jgi:hypothetical protein